MMQEIFIFGILLFFYTIIFYNKEKLSNFLKLVDHPDNKRKIHSKPTPLIGGMIIIFIIIINFYNFKNFLPEKELLILFSLILIYFFVGLVDDIKGLSSYFRLCFLFLITYFLLNLSELFVLRDLNFNYKDLKYELGAISVFISALCILLLVNALNLSDGINGLSTTLVISWFIYIKFFLFKDFSYLGISSLIILIVVFYHIYKGLFFMGDYGVTVAALVVGLMSIASYNVQENIINKIFVEEIFLLLFVPGLDMFRLFLERILKKKDPFSADKNHLHHILINKLNLRLSLLIYLLISFTPLLLYKTFSVNTLILILIYAIFYFVIFSTKIKKYF